MKNVIPAFFQNLDGHLEDPNILHEPTRGDLDQLRNQVADIANQIHAFLDRQMMNKSANNSMILKVKSSLDVLDSRIADIDDMILQKAVQP